MSVVSYKCPHCGGGLNYQPLVGFKCEYCLSVMTQEQLDLYYKDKVEDNQTENPSTQPTAQSSTQASASGQAADAVAYSCPSCGAEIITDATTAASVCHYCHNPVVMSSNLQGSFKPDAVIPFSVTKAQAEALFKNHCTGRFFLPKDFYSEKQIENLFGVYYPYWVVDAELDGHYRAVGENDQSMRVGDDRRIETTVFDVARDGNIDLNDITHSALKKADELIMRYILPFRMNELKDFSMTYLSGFRAEKRDIEKEALVSTVEKQKNEYAGYLLKNSVGRYTRLLNEQLSAQTLNETWRYALLPVWILTYRYNDKQYMFGINGQTGKTYGGLPVDKRKLTLFSILVAIAAVVLVFIIGGLFG